MANGALSQQAGQLFGTGMLASFDASGKEIGVLPGVDEIAPNPLQAASLAGTLTYTPPKQLVSSRAEQTEEGGFVAPAFEQSIFIEPPTSGDVGQVTDLAEFSSLDQNSLNALGLVGVTPTSLEQTFSNLSNITNLDFTATAINVAKNIDPAVKAGIDIARGKTIESLTNAITNPSILGTPAAIMNAHQALNAVLNLDFDKLANLPDKAVDVIGSIMQGFADLATNPAASAKAFVDMAGNYTEFGTFAPNIQSFDFGNNSINVVTDQEGNIVTKPGMISSLLPGPMKAAPMVLGAFSDFMASILAGPGLTSEEQMAEDFSVMEAAQYGPAVDLGVGVSLHSGNLGSVLSFSEVSIPGLGPAVSGLISVDRMTSDYGAQLGLAQLDIESSAIMNSFGVLTTEELEALQSFVDTNYSREDMKSYHSANMAVQMGYQAMYDAYQQEVLGLSLDEVTGMPDAYSKNLDSLQQVNAMYDYIDKLGPVGPANTARQSFQNQYPEAVEMYTSMKETRGVPGGAVDFEARDVMEVSNRLFQKRINEQLANRQKSTVDAITLAMGYDPGGWNSNSPSNASLSMATAVMGLTKSNFFGFTDEDRNAAYAIQDYANKNGLGHSSFEGIANGLDQAAKGLGYASITDLSEAEAQEVSVAVDEEEVGGYSTNAEFDAAVAEAEAEANMASIEAGVASYDIGFGFGGADSSADDDTGGFGAGDDSGGGQGY